MSEGAERIWWTRVERAAAGEGLAGRKARSDWAHDMLAVVGDAVEGLELVGPFGQRRWRPVPEDRRTEEHVQRERRRLTDQLGVRLGLGAMP